MIALMLGRVTTHYKKDLVKSNIQHNYQRKFTSTGDLKKISSEKLFFGDNTAYCVFMLLLKIYSNFCLSHLLKSEDLFCSVHSHSINLLTLT